MAISLLKRFIYLLFIGILTFTVRKYSTKQVQLQEQLQLQTQLQLQLQSRPQ